MAEYQNSMQRAAAAMDSKGKGDDKAVDDEPIVALPAMSQVRADVVVSFLPLIKRSSSSCHLQIDASCLAALPEELRDELQAAMRARGSGAAAGPAAGTGTGTGTAAAAVASTVSEPTSANKTAKGGRKLSGVKRKGKAVGSGNLPCANCEREASRVRCQQCDKTFCKLCSDTLHLARAKRKHVIRALPDKQKASPAKKKNRSTAVVGGRSVDEDGGGGGGGNSHCGVCGELAAVLRCEDCEGGLFCKGCFAVGHASEGFLLHKRVRLQAAAAEPIRLGKDAQIVDTIVFDDDDDNDCQVVAEVVAATTATMTTTAITTTTTTTTAATAAGATSVPAILAPAKPPALCGYSDKESVRGLLATWLAASPRHERVVQCCEYLERLLEARRMDIAFAVLRYLRRCVLECPEWAFAFNGILSHVQELVRERYHCGLKVDLVPEVSHA
jgi:hypothetical protein